MKNQKRGKNYVLFFKFQLQLKSQTPLASWPSPGFGGSNPA